jgi:hypothetical protein
VLVCTSEDHLENFRNQVIVIAILRLRLIGPPILPVMAPSIRSVASFHTIKPVPDASSIGEFHLPTSLRQVQNQIHRTEPESLPDEDANKHEVQYFLYQLLTVDSYRIAKSYPQWVLETCAFWRGTGADLRFMTDKEMKLICPLDSGHCTLEKKQNTTLYPSPDCRAMIGETIGQVVKKLKAKEDEKARLEREWKETQLGSSVRHKAIHGRLENRVSTNLEELFPRPRLMRSCSSAMSLPVLPERVAVPDSYEQRKIFSQHFASDGHNYTPSSTASLHPHVTTSNGSISLPLSSSKGSNSSSNMNSTAHASSAGSIEETNGKQNGASQVSLFGGDPLERRLSSAILSRSSHNSPSTICARRVSTASSMAGIAEHEQHSTNIAVGDDYFAQDYPPSYDQRRHVSTPHPQYQLQEPPTSFTQENLQEVMSRNRYHPHKPPQIIYHEYPIEQQTRYSRYSQDWDVKKDYSELRSMDSISCIRRNFLSSQSTYGSPPAKRDLLTRPHTMGPPPGIPQPYYSSVQEMSNHLDNMSLGLRCPTSSMSQRSSSGSLRRTLHPNSMNYPRPDICGPRFPSQCHAPNLPIHSPPHSSNAPPSPAIPPSKVPFPSSPTFTGPNRSTATSAVDTFALERCAYTTFKAGVLVARSEVVNSEVKRMSGMVPGKLHEEGIEHVEPTMRLMDGNGRPYSTLVGQIRDKEILDGRRQRGRLG